ncbi:MAG: phosphonate C-P lyase system protein PhnH [Pseudomonadota bacterium]
MQVQTLQGGFADPAIEAANAFRALMEAMARPGRVYEVTGATAPAPMSQAMAVTLLTLCDTDTPIYLAGALETPEVQAWIAFHTGAPTVGPSHAMFAFGQWDALQPLSQFPRGTAKYPDRSATLVVEIPALEQTGATLTGPGIETSTSLSLPETDAFRVNAALFPCGVDFIFTCGHRLAALPRTTEVT